MLRGYGIGFPDLIVFVCLFATGVNMPVIPSLQYISIAVKKYGTANLTLIIECYTNHDDNNNATCKAIENDVATGLASLTVYINTVKGICGPIFVILLGGFSDAVGKTFAINAVLLVNVLWCVPVFINTIYLTQCPPGIWIFDNGFLLGVCGGSTFTVSNFLIGYLSLTTPPQKQAARFSLLLGIGLIGYIIGPLVSGLILGYTTKYYINSLLSLASMTSALLISIFGLKKIDKKTEFDERFASMTGFRAKFAGALKFQYYNTVDLFKYQSHIGKFIAVNMMYMLTSVGLISPLVVISSVYLLADPFKWSTKARGYFTAGLGLALAIQSIFTLRILKMFKISRPGIVRVGIFLGFVGTFFLAFAATDSILLTGVGLSSFIIVASPTIQSMILSLVEPEQVGTAVGVMSAVQGFAESGLVNIILLVYNNTKHIMNGICFFSLSFLLGIDLVIAMFYQHPQTTREDRNFLTTDEETPGSPIVPSSDVLKGGAPKPSATTSVQDGKGFSSVAEFDDIYAADPLELEEN